MTLQEEAEQMRLADTLGMIEHGETPKEHKARILRLRRYTVERDALQDALGKLTGLEDADKRGKIERRLAAVLETLETLI